MDTGILFREDITENVIAIKINRSYKENITKDGLYEITRGYWKIDFKKAQHVDYAFSVFNGIIIEVYRIENGCQQDLFQDQLFRTQKFLKEDMSLLVRLQRKKSGIVT